MPQRAFGWKPDTPDKRDQRFMAAKTVNLADLPPKVSLKSKLAKLAYDQAELGSCTGQAIAGHLVFNYKKQQSLEGFLPSRLFIYYNERVLEGSVDSDAGAELRSGLKSIGLHGYCPEEDWAYDISRFREKPSPMAYANALLNRAVDYQRVSQNLSQMKGCLAAGFPFVCGFSVYESFESDVVLKTGRLQMPKSNEQLLGGHAVLCYGYDDEDAGGRFQLRNSYGPNWGDFGNFSMPYEYLVDPDLAADFWTIRFVI